MVGESQRNLTGLFTNKIFNVANSRVSLTATYRALILPYELGFGASANFHPTSFPMRSTILKQHCWVFTPVHLVLRISTTVCDLFGMVLALHT